MKKEYDFSGGVRGKFFRENKVQKTLRLDADILDYFQPLSSRKHVPYQTLIKSALREAMDRPIGGSGIDLKVLRKEIHSAVQSALQK
jgi:BrnA antitoxin of type II toxin-antitoxin system